MSSVRVIVVSDSHLSNRTPEASANWDAVVDHVAAERPDLVVHAGDISVVGHDRVEDL
jgi:predicted phosphodiesterase